MTEHQLKLDTTSFSEAWQMYESQVMTTIDGKRLYTPNMEQAFRKVFLSGGAMAIAVLSNRLAELPGTVEPGDMVKALIDTIAGAMAELEKSTGAGIQGNA